MKPPPLLCAYCGAKAQGNYTISRDGPGEGPRVPLCDDCGGKKSEPTLIQIWAKIAFPHLKQPALTAAEHNRFPGGRW